MANKKPTAKTLSADDTTDVVLDTSDDIIPGADPDPEAQQRAKENLAAVGGKLDENSSVSAYGNIITKN